MSDKEQQETEQSGWLREAKLWLKEQWHRIPLGVLVIATPCICLFCLSPEQRVANNLFLQLYLGILAFTGGVVLCIPRVITSNPKKYFITRVLVTGITGGAFALLLPIAVKSTTTGVGGLRHSILLATGGLLAILTLGETRRKNDIDKRKNKQEKKKNDKDHRRQVRAERRERYAKAVEQLGDEKAPIRMGGVYTLVGLVDEWLEDESIEKYEDRLKEGQVIINNLCAYIRSPFTLASHYDELNEDIPTSDGIYKDNQQEFYADKATLESEADVRLSIIKEIHDRLQGSSKNTPGAWSDFEYDFSGSTFFYPIDLTNSYYAKPINFSGSTYEGWAYFSGSTYKGGADFSGSTYKGWADFTDSTYKDVADFTSSTYKSGANFSRSTYKGGAYFTYSTYKSGADFTDSTYKGGAYFSRSTYKGWANFTDSTYKGGADFSGSTYQVLAYFSGSTYKGGADFSGSTYQVLAYFSGSTYQDVADFSGSIFYQKVYFGADGDNSSFSRFTDCAPQFYDETNHKNTLFGSPNNDFTVENGRGYPIYRNLDGLPLGCKFLTSEQKEYLADKFREIEKINNKLCEVKDPEENTKLLDTLESFEKELYEWQEEATTVNVEDVAAEDTES